MKTLLRYSLDRWKGLSRRTKILLPSAGGVVGVGCIAMAVVWHYFAAEAEGVDMAALHREVSDARVLDARGEYAGNAAEVDRKPVKLADVSPLLVQAVIATEDARFYSHNGYDPVGLMRAAVANLKAGSVKQGGSTITQQLARNAFGLEGRSYKRKIREIFLARRIEKACSKDQILELYLNRIYLGSSFYGVGAAARGYFGKEVRDLNLTEAATLAGIIKAPTAYSPFTRPELATQKRNLTLARMADRGAITRADADAAVKQPLGVLDGDRRRKVTGYMLAAVRDEFGATKAVPEADGTVTATLRVDWQRKMDELMRQHLARIAESFPGSSSSQPLEGAAVVLDNDTGAVLAMTGGRDFMTSPFNRALDGRRPAGTAFLPLVHAAALSVKPELLRTPVLDGPMDNREVMVGGRNGTLGEWGGEQDQVRYQGLVAPLYALQAGRTAATVRLGYAAGIEPMCASLARGGIQSALRTNAAMMLGQSYVRPVEVAQAFTALANGGRSCGTPHVLARTATTAKYPFTPNAASLVRNTLVMRMLRPEYQEVLQASGLERQGIGGYGGTAYGFTDAWFAGFDRQVTCVVWIGHDKDAPIAKEAWSVNTAFPLWAEVFKLVTEGQVKGWTEKPRMPYVCVRSGRLVGERCPDHENGTCLISTSGTDLNELKQIAIPRAIVVPEDGPSTASIKPIAPVVIGDDVYQKPMQQHAGKSEAAPLASMGR